MNIKSIWKRIVSDIKNYYIAILLFGVLNIIVRAVFHAFCPFLIITGFPCAGCGMTRAVICLLTGQFTRGMNLNPAAPFWIAWIAFFLFERYVRGENSKWNNILLGIVVVITLAVYVYRMLTQFPGNPPMTYYRNNVLTKYSTILRDLLQYIE
ncbi:MAG: DUF2752 domain-containing protein [Lachnospiraceae bacterium]|nr:DUF2752 domain-containing protein [Lachnospiraceae bacterium]MBQ6887072.1 DUF2752 domain-containing protein [Lachnospiraceae bacterium]